MRRPETESRSPDYALDRCIYPKRHYDVHFIVKDSTVLKNRFTLSTGKVNASDVLYDLETVSNICFTEVEDGLFEVGTK